MRLKVNCRLLVSFEVIVRDHAEVGVDAAARAGVDELEQVRRRCCCRPGSRCRRSAGPCWSSLIFEIREFRLWVLFRPVQDVW